MKIFDLVIREMFIQFLISIFIVVPAFAGFPPGTMRGQLETGKITTFNFEAPYYQATTTAPSTRLIETGNTNVLANPSFESSTVAGGWTSSSGTNAAETTIVAPGGGKKSLKITLSAVSGTILTQTVTPSDQFAGNNIDGSMWVKTAQANLQVCAMQGTTEVLCVDVPSDSLWHNMIAGPVAGPTSGSIGVRLKSKASVTGDVYVDSAYAGISKMIGSVPTGGVLWAKASWVSITNCAWSSTSTSYSNFAADTDCNNPTVIGYGSAAGTKIPGFTISNFPAGDYQIFVTGVLLASGNTASGCYWRMTDGTNATNAAFLYTNSGITVSSPSLALSLKTASDQTNVTLQMQTLVDGTGGTPTCNINPDNATKQVPYGFEIAVYRMPSAATNQQTFSIAQTNVWGYATWPPTTGASASSSSQSWTTFSDTDFATNRTNSGSCTTDSSSEISCKFAYLPAGTYEVTYNGFLITGVTTNGVQANCSFGIYDGTTRRVASGYAAPLASLQNGSSIGTVTGTFTYTTPQTNIVFKLQAYAEGANISCGVNMDGGLGTRSSQLTVKPISIATPMPLFTNSVIKSSTVYDLGSAGLTSIDSGIYTPTVTNSTNVTSSVAHSCNYMRIGATVLVSCATDIRCTASATFTQFYLSLPVASNLANGYDLNGVMTGLNGNEAGAVSGDGVNDRAQIDYKCNTTGSAYQMNTNFQYTVK